MRYIYLMRILLAFLLIVLTTTSSFAQEVPEDKSAARIFAYFMIGQDTHPEANIRLDQFEAHLQTLKNESTPTALPAIIDAWKNNSPLADKTTAITFDGGHRSILTQALPLLKKYSVPFTVFIATDLANIGAPQYLDWDDIKKLQKSKLATIGMHTASYGSLDNIDTFTKNLNKARARFREELNEVPTLFSFPLGEYDSSALKLIDEQGFTAIGQHSGVAYTNKAVLPRFTMNEYYSDETRLNMILNALPLPATDVYPLASISTNPKKALTAFGLTTLYGNDDVRCYGFNEGINIEKINDTRIEIRSAARMLAKRQRINCIEKTKNDKIRWFGFLAIR